MKVIACFELDHLDGNDPTYEIRKCDLIGVDKIEDAEESLRSYCMRKSKNGRGISIRLLCYYADADLILQIN